MSSPVRFMSFSSGSCGNCYYFECGGKAVLIDAGASIRSIKKAMVANGLSLEAVSAVLVTHDHLDHIRNLGSFCKRLNRPVYASAQLHKALEHHTFTAPHIGGCRRILEAGKWNPVGSMLVRVFEVPHDASHTCGFAIAAEDRKFFIMTDADRVTDEVLLSPQAQRISLRADNAEWAGAILGAKRAEADRTQGAETVRQAGYDIRREARKLEEIYLDMAARAEAGTYGRK